MLQPRSEGGATPAQSVRDHVLELSRAYILSRAIHTAAELGVADHVGETPVPVSRLAELTQAQRPFLERLLRFLAGHQIFKEVGPGEFVATPESNVLRKDAPDSLHPALCMVNAGWWAAVGGLGHTVKTGENAFEHVNHEPFFAYLKARPKDQLRFDAGMANNSRSSDAAIARAYDFSRFGSVMDVGGGHGGLVRAIVETHPGVQGILFDQPQVVERAVAPKDPAAAARYGRKAGDFFQAVPSGADAYVIKGVLHDFDDERCVAILKNIRQAMSAQGRLLIVERMVCGDNQAHQAKTIDVLMMALLGGRERCVDDWKALLQGAGFRLVKQHPTASEFNISEAVPA